MHETCSSGANWNRKNDLADCKHESLRSSPDLPKQMCEDYVTANGDRDQEKQ